MSKRIDFKNIKVEVTLRNKGEMKAQIAIEYFGLRISHFRIMVDRETKEPFVQMPSLRVYNKYQQMFWIPNKEDFTKFQDFLLKEYYEFKTKTENGEIEDNTPMEEINF